MYTPRIYKQEDPEEIKRFIRQYSFGTLVSQTATGLWATHIPLELSEDESRLHAHISKANPQWKNLEATGEVLAIFTGPHAYISPSWYDHENVPTWNYQAVHVYGTLRIIEGEELNQAMKRLVDKYESHSKNPISVERMSPEYYAKEIRGVVGLEVSISRMEATYKLSQNRDKKNHEAIVRELEKRDDVDSHRVAEAMRNYPPHHSK